MTIIATAQMDTLGKHKLTMWWDNEATEEEIIKYFQTKGKVLWIKIGKKKIYEGLK